MPLPVKRRPVAVKQKKIRAPPPDADEQPQPDVTNTAVNSDDINKGEIENPTTSAVDCAAQASGMTTYQLLSNKDTLLAGIDLLCKLTSKKLNADQVGQKLGLQESRRAREVSPDSQEMFKPSKGKGKQNNCSTASDDLKESRLRPRKPKVAKDDKKESKARREGLHESKKTVSEENSRSNNLASSIPTGSKKKIDKAGVVSTVGILDENEDPNNENSNQVGEALFRELVSRSDNAQLRCDPKDVDLDAMLTQTCTLSSIVPQYEEKSEMFKTHSKKITDMTIKKLTKSFKKITPQIEEILNGGIISARQELYMEEGLAKRKELKEMNVSVPFDNDQGTALFSLLYDLVVPDPLERSKFADYINFVLLPESFIRIYAHVNHVSYETASTEMRFGACYDGPLLQ